MKVNQNRFAKVEAGAFIEPGVIIGSMVEIGANAVLLSQHENLEGGSQTRIGSNVRIGANSTIYPGVSVGDKAVVEPGSVVTRSIPPLAIVRGNPATIIGYVLTHSEDASVWHGKGGGGIDGVVPSRVNGVSIHKLKIVSDLRGNLSVGEFEREIPFDTKRYFLVFDVPSAETRGEHAHYQCKQFLICVRGSCNVIADDGNTREEFILDGPDKGLYLPPMTWSIQYKYTSDAILLVFASNYYDAEDYIRDYDVFLSKYGIQK